MTNPSSKTVGERPKIEKIYTCDSETGEHEGPGMYIPAHLATAFMDARDAEIERLTRELQDFEGILSAGTCVNDKIHKRYLGCLYCRAEEAEASNASLVERVGKLEQGIRSHLAQWVTYPDSPLHAALASAEEKNA